jgi:hypothetical protein
MLGEAEGTERPVSPPSGGDDFLDRRNVLLSASPGKTLVDAGLGKSIISVDRFGKRAAVHANFFQRRFSSETALRTPR